MARAQTGDREAYRALLDDIGPAIMRFLGRRVADRHEIEDLYQETLIAVHRARHTYDPARPFEPWLFAVARHVLIDHQRRRLARLSWEVLVDMPPERAADPPGDAHERLEDALRRLPAAQREAFEMLKLEGMSVEAGAARAGTTTGAFKVRAHRAYRTIKALLGG
jgi:RNA polymerase sigma-70 factor (ECF subfamily)